MLEEVLTVIDNHQAAADLSLMVLGNAATTILNNKVPPAHREALAKQFGKVLLSSVEQPKQS